MGHRTWTLKRVAATPHETYGVLIRDDLFPICVTLENAWRDNNRGESCIPCGTWLCEPYDAPTYGQTWEVDVPNRSAILFHAGNTEENTEGCILLGSKFGERLSLDITESRVALARFKDEQPWRPFWLHVTWG